MKFLTTPVYQWSTRSVLAFSFLFGSVCAAQTPQSPLLDPATLIYKLPQDIKWVADPSGIDRATLLGDPTKPGRYIVLARWHAHHISRAHFHPNDRFIVVLSGTWWVGTGDSGDPNKTVPMPAGSFITHFANQVHYDGAKDEDCLLEITGEGPGSSIPYVKK